MPARGGWSDADRRRLQSPLRWSPAALTGFTMWLFVYFSLFGVEVASRRRQFAHGYAAFRTSPMVDWPTGPVGDLATSSTALAGASARRQILKRHPISFRPAARLLSGGKGYLGHRGVCEGAGRPPVVAGARARASMSRSAPSWCCHGLRAHRPPATVPAADGQRYRLGGDGPPAAQNFFVQQRQG